MEKLEIWGKVIPGNRSARKDMVMEIQKKKNPDHTIDLVLHWDRNPDIGWRNI